MLIQLLQYRFIRFLLIGVINTIVGYSLFAFFLYIGFHYTIATLFSTILGVLFNFKSIGIFVFESHDNKLIFRFILMYIFIYILNILGLYILKVLNYTNMYWNGLVLIVPLAIISFMLNKFFVFSGDRE